MRREQVNLATIINFDGLRDRYERAQRLIVLEGAAKVRITGADLSSGGLPRTLKAPSYTLLLTPLEALDAPPIQAGTVSLSAPVFYADIPVDATKLNGGWYKMGLAGAADGESVYSFFCFVRRGDAVPAYMPVTRGSYSRSAHDPSANIWTVVPSKYAPQAAPLTRAIDEANVPDPALRRSGLHCDALVPIRWADTHRPNVDKNGVLSTFDAQAYHWSQLHNKFPTVPCLDGKRGVGTVAMATHLEVGEALVPVAGNPAWPQTPSGFYRVANTYFCDPWRFGKIRQDGTVITMVGWRHKGVMGHWEDGIKDGYVYPDGLKHGLELVGDWSAIPEDRRGFWELWGCAWDRRRSGAANVGGPSPDPREKGLIPHPVGGGMVTFHPDTQHNRIVRCEFPHDTHFDYNRTKVTEFLTGLQDPWDCVGDDNGVLYVSERKAHRICAYSMDSGQLLRVVVQGQPLATVNVNRDVITSGTLDQRRAAPCVAPEGLYLQDGWLYFASIAQAQVRRVHLTTGELQVVRTILVDGNSKFAKLALSDGTFGPRGSTFTWSWTGQFIGGPEMWGPIGPNGEPAKPILKWWNDQSGGTGDWTSHAGYGTAGCAQFGRMVTACMVEGVKIISKSMPGDKPMSAVALRGQTEYRNRSLYLTHGDAGFGYYGLPLPWGVSADVDEFLLSQGHVKDAAPEPAPPVPNDPPPAPIPPPSSGYANLTSIVKRASDNWAPSGDAKLPLTMILHGSGGGDSALSFGSNYTSVTTGDLARSVDTELRWAVRQGLPAGTISVLPSDKRNNTVASWTNWETYHLGFVESGVLHLITERQYDQLMAWVDANVPQAHKTKRYVTGGSMGAWGAMTYGVRRANMFAAIFADRPRVRYSGTSPNRISVPGVAPLTYVYNVGSDPALSAVDGGTQSAAHMDCVAYLANPANPAPWVGWCLGRNDGYTPFQDHIDLVAAMRSAGRGFAFAWNNGNHETGSIMAQITDSYSGIFEIGVGYPVFSEHSLDADPAVDALGGINLGLKFRNVVESAGSWSCEVTHISSACTVKVKPHSAIYTGNPAPALVNIPAANTWVQVSF